jgi:hypothetical protein
MISEYRLKMADFREFGYHGGDNWLSITHPSPSRTQELPLERRAGKKR